MRILVVEDNARVAAIVGAALRTSGHVVETAGGRSAAIAELERSRFDLAIIDVGLPDGSGLDVCRAAREGGHDLPIMLLTAHNEIGDRVAGLDAGADDYLGKPFSTAELTARVRALGRRGPRWSEGMRRFGAVVVDRERRIVTIDDARVPLTARELDIVALLAWADGRVVARDDVLEAVWGEANERTSASLEVLLTRIRRKLAPAGAPEVVRTVRNVGYAWALARSKPS